MGVSSRHRAAEKLKLISQSQHFKLGKLNKKTSRFRTKDQTGTQIIQKKYS